MQRHGILNSHIAKVLADLGHTDTICIADCGLPVPQGVQKIDLALDFGVPSFEQVVSIIAKHMKSEAVHAAKEIKEHNPEAYDFLESTFPSSQYEWIETSHEAFKEATKQCKCIIRTGEASPYANIILRADCIYYPQGGRSSRLDGRKRGWQVHPHEYPYGYSQGRRWYHHHQRRRAHLPEPERSRAKRCGFHPPRAQHLAKPNIVRKPIFNETKAQ